MQTTLYSLFMPPQDDYFGDFGLLCGFTATPQVLGQIRRTFSGEITRPALAAFIHPTVNALSDIPGLAWMWMRLHDRGYNLLHAKVALLGFRKREGDGYVVRLAVSTGNWTQDPLTDSIDLYWKVDVDTNAARPDPRAVADLRAAWEMFGWLRERADCSLIERDYDGHRPADRLAAAIAGLPETAAMPRFIDSRVEALFPQVAERLSQGRKGEYLILGSGYFEAAVDGDAGVPERLRQDLQRRKALRKDAGLHLFLNPQSCQGLAARAESLADAGWDLRPPYARGREGAKLHAKFALLASGDDDVKGRLYLGSGNLSRNGFEKAAKDGGNLEAGVVIDLPAGLKRFGKDSISSRLPVQFKDTVELQVLQPGEAFIRPEEPELSPPVSWLSWQEDVLRAPEDTPVVVINPDGEHRPTPCGWPGPAPTIVTLAEGGWRLPVIADGVLVAPCPREMTVEDVLAGLGTFPEPPEGDRAGDDAGEDEPPADPADTRETPPATYAIRRMMSLLVPLGEAQAWVDPRDWQRWCRELRQNLCAIREQEQAMIGFFRRAQADPLPVLAELCPEGADTALLDEALAAIALRWELNHCPSLWAGKDQGR